MREPPRFDRKRIDYNSSTSSGPPQRGIVKSRISSTPNHPREPLSNHADTGDLARPVRRHSPIQRSNPPTHSGFAQDGAGEAKCHPFRIHPVLIAVRVDECRHDLGRRSSSAWVKYADALRRISFARRSSRFLALQCLQILALRTRQLPHDDPGRVRPVVPICAMSRSCSRSSQRPTRSPPTATHDPAGAQTPCAPLVLGPPGSTCSKNSRLAPLKSKTLRSTGTVHTRYSSIHGWRAQA